MPQKPRANGWAATSGDDNQKKMVGGAFQLAHPSRPRRTEHSDTGTGHEARHGRDSRWFARRAKAFQASAGWVGWESASPDSRGVVPVAGSPAAGPGRSPAASRRTKEKTFESKRQNKHRRGPPLATPGTVPADCIRSIHAINRASEDPRRVRRAWTRVRGPHGACSSRNGNCIRRGLARGRWAAGAAKGRGVTTAGARIGGVLSGGVPGGHAAM